MYGKETKDIIPFTPIPYITLDEFSEVYDTQNPHSKSFEIKERPLPKGDLGVGNYLSERQYAWLMAMQTALTYAALNSTSFPGARCDAGAYYNEYAAHPSETSARYNKAIIETLRSLASKMARSDGKICVAEIGAQQADWAKSQLLSSRFSVVSAYFALDLSYATRVAQARPHLVVSPTHIQGDAHYLTEDSLPQRPDAFIAHNMLDLTFDPWLILNRLWQTLNDQGVIIIGETVIQTYLPLLLRNSQGEILHCADTGRLLNFKPEMNKNEALTHQWQKASDELKAIVDGAGRFYFASQAKWDLAVLGQVVSHLYEKLPEIWTTALYYVLRHLGIQVDRLFSDTFYRNGEVLVIHKEGQENPFNLQKAPIVGVSSKGFHCGEYPFLQVDRCLSVPDEFLSEFTCR